MARQAGLFKLLRIYKKQVAALFFLSLLSSVFLLFAPYMSKLFVDKAFVNKDLGKFINLSILSAAVFVLGAFFSLLNSIIKNKIAIKLKLSLSRKFIDKFYSLDIAFFNARSSGENIYRFRDTEPVANFITEQLPGLIADSVKLFIILAVSFWINARLTFVLLFLSPLFLIHSVYIQSKLRPIYEEIWRQGAELSRQLYEGFSHTLIIKALGAGHFKKTVYLKSLLRNIRWQVKSFRWAIVSSLSSDVLSKLVYGLITLYGGWLIIKGSLTLGSFTAVMIYITQIGMILSSFGYRLEHLVREAVSVERFFEVIDKEPQIKDSPQAVSPGRLEGEIKFNNVHFGYQRDSFIFKDFSLVIPPFTYVGIAGHSGCGKTTLVNLFLRLYDPQKGSIFLDGTDLKDISLKFLRNKIAVATQQPFLFDASVRDNIAFGLKDAKEEAVIEAAKIACAHEFIEKLPLDYDTILGEDACRISQGQKQRIALARAIIRNPGLLILDEALSCVDLMGEENILQHLKEKRQGLSTVVISHRASSIKAADIVYFFGRDNQMVTGRHEELLNCSPEYKSFFHS